MSKNDNTKTREEVAKDFIKEYGELVQKYQMDFANYPVPTFTPNDKGSFTLEVSLHGKVVDLTALPKQENKEGFVANK